MESQPKLGDIVISLAGHDKGKPFVVVATLNEKFVLIADGTTRRAEAPKLKKTRHLRVVAESDGLSPTNAALKKRIKQFLQERRLYAEK